MKKPERCYTRVTASLDSQGIIYSPFYAIGADAGGGPDAEFFGGTSLNHHDGFYAFNAYFQGGVFVGGR